MTELLDDELQVWLPSEYDEERRTRSARLASGAAELYISVPAGDEFPQLHVDERGTMTSIRVDPGVRVRVALRMPTRDAVTLWQPGSGKEHSRIPASWEDPQIISALDGFAVGALLAPEDRTIAAWAADAADERLQIRAGLIEETAELLVSFEAVRDLQQPLHIELELGRGSFTDTVATVVERVYGSWVAVKAADQKPVLCTWYFMHLDVDGSRLRDMAAAAGELGFGTLIIDDGWQTAETGRGYGTAGDWVVNRHKVADPETLVRAFHDSDIRVLWWVGTPFAGYRTDAFVESTALFHEPALEAAIIDPRIASNRERLIMRLRRLLTETGADGLKLDFLERLTAPRVDVDVDEQSSSLIRELVAALRATDPDLSIEFREPYFGPAATRSATMMRVADCPMSPTRNRIGIVDLRLATRGAAVHADPVMWGDDDSVDRVAQHLQNALFGVIQVSMDITALHPDQLEVLQFWLAFASEHSAALLQGTFQPERPDLDYPVISSSSNTTVITGRYHPGALQLPGGDWSTWHIANADGARIPVLEAENEVVSVTIRDPRGRVVSKSRGPFPELLHVPTGGLATIERTGSETRGPRSVNVA